MGSGGVHNVIIWSDSIKLDRVKLVVKFRELFNMKYVFPMIRSVARGLVNYYYYSPRKRNYVSK